MTIQAFNADKYLDGLLTGDGQHLPPAEQKILAKLKAADAAMPRVRARIEQIEQERQQLTGKLNQLAGQAQVLSALLIEAEGDRQPVVQLADLLADGVQAVSASATESKSAAVEARSNGANGVTPKAESAPAP